MKKMVSYFILGAMFFSAQTAYAEGVKQGAASFVLPTTGQYMNGEFNESKTKLMAGMEVAAITTTVLLATLVGGPVVWAATAHPHQHGVLGLDLAGHDRAGLFRGAAHQ